MHGVPRCAALLAFACLPAAVDGHVLRSLYTSSSLRVARVALPPVASLPQWEPLGDCRLLRPPPGVKAQGVVHFLGGVFVSPQPEVAYRYMLESLAARGYMVVATPFSVEFEYAKPAAEIYAKFSEARELLAAESSRGAGPGGAASAAPTAALPLYALGHSLGALMQTLLCCTYEDYADACAGSALLSYNNKPASEAIPAFEQLFVPALAPLEPWTRSPAYANAVAGAKGLRQFGFGIARAGLERAAPLLSQLPSPLAPPMRARDGIRGTGGVSGTGGATGLADDLAARLDLALRDAEALASLADQVPSILSEISRGTSEFTPTPAEMRSLVGSRYEKPRAPLVVEFSVDSLDESPALMAALPVTAGARKLDLTGTHLTPLAIDPRSATSALLLPTIAAEALAGADEKRAALLGDVDVLVKEVDAHFRRRKVEVEVEAKEEAKVAAEAAKRAAAEAAKEAEAAQRRRVEAAKADAATKAEEERRSKERLLKAEADKRRADVAARVAARAASGSILVDGAKSAVGRGRGGETSGRSSVAGGGTPGGGGGGRRRRRRPSGGRQSALADGRRIATSRQR